MNLFMGIDDKKKNKLLKELYADIITFKKNVVFLSSMENDKFIGYIENGHIQIIKEDYNGNRSIEEELFDGDTFGSVLSAFSKEAKFIPKEDGVAIIIDYNRIVEYKERSDTFNQFLKNLFFIMNDKSKEKNERIEILTQRGIRNKLLTYFDIMSKKNNSKNIYLPFSFLELADYLAVDRSAMSREMRYLKEEGFIEVKGRRITLLQNTRFDKDYELIHL